MEEHKAAAKYQASTKASARVEELLAADQDDASLARYKVSLLGAATAAGDLGDASDPRKLVVVEFRVVFEDDSKGDASFDLSTEAGIAELKRVGLTIKEGANFKFQLSFRVNHELLEGLKFVNRTVRDKLGSLSATQEELMMGSYAPASRPHAFTFPRYGWNECPAGMLYRGTYTCHDAFVDSNGVKHLEYSYPLVIGKSW